MRYRRQLFSFIAAVILFASPTLSVGAQLPAPNFLPGFPMLAGPQIMLMWGPVPGAVKYVVYMNGDKVAEPTAMQHFMPAPAGAGSYAFEVAGVDGEGAVGAKSGKGIVQIIKLEPPKDLRTLVREGTLSLGWGKAPGAVIYDVYRSYEKGKQGSLIESVTELNYSDPETKDAEPGKAFYYTLVAKDVAGAASEPSEQVEYVVAAAAEAAAGRIAVVPIKAKLLWEVQHGDYSGSGEKVSMIEPYDCVLNPAGDNLFISVSNNGRIVVLNPEDGDMLMTMGLKTEDMTEDNGWLKRPKGLALSGGLLYVTDDLRKDIQVFDSTTGAFQFVITPQFPDDFPEERKMGPIEPRDVLVASSGDIYVLDYRNGVIFVYDSRGGYSRAIIPPKPGPGQTGSLSWPTYLIWANDSQSEIAVTSPGTTKIVFLDTDGKFIREFGEKKAAPGGDDMMSGTAIDSKRSIIYVADLGGSFIQVFDLETGKYLGILISDDGETGLPIIAPLGIYLDNKDNLYTPLGIAKRVKKFQMIDFPNKE